MATKSTTTKYIFRAVTGIVILTLAITVFIQNRRINALTGKASKYNPQEDTEKYKAENDRLKSQLTDMQAWQDYLENALNEKDRDPDSPTQNRLAGNRIPVNAPSITNNPARRNGLRSLISSRYDALAEEIDLSEETKSKLMDLLAEMQLEIMNKLPGRGGFSPEMIDRESLRDQIDEIRSKYDKKLSELLSEDELHAFREYQNSEPERMLIMRFNGNLFEGDNMLDKETEKELVDAMYNARQTDPDTKRENSSPSFLGRPFGPPQMNEGPENTEKLNSIYLESARAILSEDQMKKFEDYLNTRRSLFNMRRGPR